MREILHYLARMLPAALLALGVYGLTRPPRFKRLRARGLTTTAWHEGGLALFLVLAGWLLWLTVFPEFRWEDGHLALRYVGLGGVNLRPLVIFYHARILARQGNSTYFLINFWGNIAMFLPIGFFPALLWRRGRWWKALLTGAGLSLAIELCQLPTARGTDIDDLWLNTLGAVLGYALAWLVQRAWPGAAERCKVQEAPSWT